LLRVDLRGGVGVSQTDRPYPAIVKLSSSKLLGRTLHQRHAIAAHGAAQIPNTSKGKPREKCRQPICSATSRQQSCVEGIYEAVRCQDLLRRVRRALIPFRYQSRSNLRLPTCRQIVHTKSEKETSELRCLSSGWIQGLLDACALCYSSLLPSQTVEFH
jgi:hypothetical protein